MASTFKSIFKDTAIYGISSVAGRFLNWLLTFLYVKVLLPEEFGLMTNIYAWIALSLVVLTYGMETTFFRFASKHDQPQDVYTTTLYSVGSTALLFIATTLPFQNLIAKGLHIADSGFSAVLMVILIAALDAFNAIPMGYLRYTHRSWKFLQVQMGFIGWTILFTPLVLVGLPYLSSHYPAICSQWYRPEWHLHYILAINLLGNIFQSILLLPTILRIREGRFSWSLLRPMLNYALPILLLGLVGAFNNQADKIIFPMLFDNPTEGNAQLGIYSACYKLAVIMVLFTQAFRYSYDPFVFSRSKEGEEQAKIAYADAMKYYLIFTLFIFVGIMSILPQLRILISPAYYSGIVVVPYIMAGQLMFGIYFNLSVWYKLTDRTYWGAILSIIGCGLSILIIVLGAKSWGFMACAYASAVSNITLMILSYFLGQHYYPIRYPLCRMGLYILAAIGVLVAEYILKQLELNEWTTVGINITLLLSFALFVLWRENAIDQLHKILRRKSHKG